jgi:cyclopropane fatty-acyl-phospholipid synthase-like methyltransferase
MEALTNVLPFERGTRVLDLGTGTALTSIFLAKEFEVSVVAADLWVDPTENQRRVRGSHAGECLRHDSSLLAPNHLADPCFA